MKWPPLLCTYNFAIIVAMKFGRFHISDCNNCVQWTCCRALSSGIWRRVGRYKFADVLEGGTTSIFRSKSNESNELQLDQMPSSHRHGNVKSDKKEYFVILKLWAGRSGFDYRQCKIFLFSIASRPALEPTQPPIQWIPATLPPWLRPQGREADHSPPSSAEDKNSGVIPHSPICLHRIVLN
jgi:hypothetical protein